MKRWRSRSNSTDDRQAPVTASTDLTYRENLMAKITFITASGEATTVDAPAGEALMRIALDNGITGIEAECGGSMMCATCHIYIAPEFMERVGPRQDGEGDMLEGAASELRDTSRLSCQVIMRPDLDGMVVHLPESQF